MKCDHCHTNEATVHMTNIVNNQKTEQHLCSSCANKLQKDGKLSPFSSFVNDIWDNDFFSNDFFKNMVYPDVEIHLKILIDLGNLDALVVTKFLKIRLHHWFNAFKGLLNMKDAYRTKGIMCLKHNMRLSNYDVN